MIEEHAQRTGSPRRARVLARWDALLAAGAFVKVMPHDYKRVLARARGAGAESDGVRSTPSGGRRLMGKLGGFLQIERARRALPRRRPSASHDYREFLLVRAPARAARPGRALHGLRRAVLPQRAARSAT